MCFLSLEWHKMEKMPQAFSSHQKAGRKGGWGARGRGKPRPLPLSPFPLPREMIIRLYETDSKRVLLRELIFYFSFKTHISQTLPRTGEKIILNKK